MTTWQHLSPNRLTFLITRRFEDHFSAHFKLSWGIMTASRESLVCAIQKVWMLAFYGVQFQFIAKIDVGMLVCKCTRYTEVKRYVTPSRFLLWALLSKGSNTKSFQRLGALTVTAFIQKWTNMEPLWNFPVVTSLLKYCKSLPKTHPGRHKTPTATLKALQASHHTHI